MVEYLTYKSIGEICDIVCGQDYKSVQDVNGVYPIYGTGGIMGYASEFRCPANSVIVGRKGNINNPIFVEEPFWNVDTAFGVVPKSVVPKYFFYFCRNYDFSKHDVSVTIPSLRRTDILKIQVPIRTQIEQERIVAELDLLTEIIDKQKQQLKELDTLAQSVYHSMFNDKIAASEGWRQCKVGDVYKFQYGKGNRIPESKGNYPCYGSNGMVGYHIHYNSEDAPIIGHIGAYAGIVNWGAGKHFVTYNGVMCWLKSKQTNPIYGYYMLKSQNYLEMARNGMAQPFVSYDKLEAPTIYLPPLSLQESFAKKIQSIESQKQSINRSLAESQKLFDYTMDKYFG